jgi:hypothetical protein
VKRIGSILLAGLLLVAGVTVAMAGHRLVAAGRRVGGARDDWFRTHATAQEILSLRARAERIAPSPRPERDIIARVNSILADLGMPGSRHFGGLAADDRSEASAPGLSAFRRQTLRLSLRDVSPLQLGRFLAAWRRDEPLLKPVRIEIAHRREDASETNRYEVSLALAAIHLATDQ